MTPLRRIQSAEQNMEDIESIMEPLPTQTPEQDETMELVPAGAASEVTGLETVEVMPVNPERMHSPSQAHAPQDALTEVTSSIPASLPPLIPASQTSIGPMAPHPEGMPESILCPICQDPVCQGEQEHDIHCLSCRGVMHRIDICPMNAINLQSIIDQMEHKRGALANSESTIPSEVPTPWRRWVKERDTEEEF